jgi:gluconokinase
MKAVLDLSNAPEILFFFGLAGAGKSYVGNLVGSLAGWTVYDADEDISDEMRCALANQQPFTESMRAEYFPRIAKKICLLHQQYGRLVVTQGVYKQQYRHELIDLIPAMEMLCVSSSTEILQQRLMLRSQGISLDSAYALIADFEIPAPDIRMIHNDGDDDNIVQQLNSLYASDVSKKHAP